MAMQARRVQIIVARNLIARLTRSKPSVNFSALDMLACAAFSRHATHLTHCFVQGRPPGGGRGLIPKHPVMRRPSRDHIGTAIAPFEPSPGCSHVNSSRGTVRASNEAAIPLTNRVFLQ